MSKADIMRFANMLMGALETCGDGDFVDEVCANIAANTPFSMEEIDNAEREEDN